MRIACCRRPTATAAVRWSTGHGGDRRKAAKVLAIGERTLYRKLKPYRLE
jgi:DNA-binding NtrC family response regulator